MAFIRKTEPWGTIRTKTAEKGREMRKNLLFCIFFLELSISFPEKTVEFSLKRLEIKCYCAENSLSLFLRPEVYQYYLCWGRLTFISSVCQNQIASFCRKLQNVWFSEVSSNLKFIVSNKTQWALKFWFWFRQFEILITQDESVCQFFFKSNRFL